MSKSYKITTMQELATAAQKADDPDLLLHDLGMWLELAREWPNSGLDKVMHFDDRVFLWNDDGKKGVSGIEISLPDDEETK